MQWRVLPMINYREGIETLISQEPGQQNDHLTEKIYSFSPGNTFIKKVKRKTNVKGRIPLCNWTMPAQPQGYLRAGKYDLL